MTSLLSQRGRWDWSLRAQQWQPSLGWNCPQGLEIIWTQAEYVHKLIWIDNKKKKLFSEHQRSVCRLRLRGHSDQDQPQFKNHEEQILFNRTITQQVLNFSLRKKVSLASFWKSFSFFFTQVPDSLRLDSAHRDDRQVWYKEISQENKSDIFVNFSTVFSFTLDYEYFKGTDLYLFRWQPHMFLIPVHQFHLMF